MLDTTTFVGLDVHARSIKAVSLDVMTGEVRCATFGYDAGAVAEWVRSVDPRARLFLIAFIFRKSRDKSFGFHDDCFAS